MPSASSCSVLSILLVWCGNSWYACAMAAFLNYNPLDSVLCGVLMLRCYARSWASAVTAQRSQESGCYACVIAR